jgi:hypothetical protein
MQLVHHELVDGVADFRPVEFDVDGLARVMDLDRLHRPTFALAITQRPIPNSRPIIAENLWIA